jgi:hypothetical protein
MAIKGTLQLKGSDTKYSVVECDYLVSRWFNTYDGKPYDGPFGGTINVTIATPAKGHGLYEWMLNDDMKKDGTITLVTNLNDSKKTAYRYLIFENAYCTNLFEYFNQKNTNMMTTRIVITALRFYFSDGNGNSIGYSNELHRTLHQTGGRPSIID